MNKKIMILAAGRGERLKPLTNTIPKALIEVRGKPLIIHHIEKCAASGYSDIVINLAHLGTKIQTALGNGKQWGVNITYSPEQSGGLETGGGIINALPLLGSNPFITINADVYTDYDFSSLPELDDQLAHLVLVENPEHNEKGDFALNRNMLIENDTPTLTFAGIAMYHPQFFNQQQATRQSIVPLLREHATNHQVSGEVHRGLWYDVGTPERLDYINSI